MNNNHQEKVWQQQSQRWNHVGQPTRPGKEDQACMLKLASETLDPLKSARIAVLGVTPEVIQLSWPHYVELKAFDQSAQMIDAVWQPNTAIPSQVHQSYWQDLPLETNSMDLVVGDGCLTALQGLDAGGKVMAEVRRVLRPEGRLIMRCFIRPPQREALEKIADDARHGNIQFFGSLKWRLAMAMADEITSTVAPKMIWDTFNKLFPDNSALTRQAGWSLDTIDTINSYRDMDGLFTFPLISQLSDLCSPYFNIEAQFCGNYELAERCPTLAFRPL